MLGFVNFVSSQNSQKRLDSLLNLNESHPKEDSVKLVLYNHIYRQYIALRNRVKTDEYIDKSISLAQKLNLKWYEAEAYRRKALGHHGRAEYQKAADNYEKAISAYSAAKDLDNVAGMYLNLGALYQGIPDYARSLEMSQRAMIIYQNNGNIADLGSVYTNIAGIYQSLGQHANAFNYLSKALKIFQETSSRRGIAVVFNSIGSNYMEATPEEMRKMGKVPSEKINLALAYLLDGLKVGLDLNDASVISPLYRDLGKAYQQLGRADEALKAYQKSIDYSAEIENKTDYGNTLLALGHFYMELKAYDKAFQPLTEALKIANKDQTLDLQKDAYRLLSEIEEMRGNYNSSLAFYKQYIVVKDHIFSQEKEQEITRKQLQIDFAVKEKDYQLQQQTTNAALQRQVLLARAQQQKLVLRQQALDLSDKEKRLQRLTFLQKQAELEAEKRVQLGLRAKEQLQAKLGQELKDKEINFQKSELQFNRNITTFLSVLVAILFGSAVVVFLAQRNTAKLNAIVLRQKAELEKLGQVKDRIFSVVGHDMRSPVNSLISFIQLLEDGQMDQKKLNRYAAQLKNTLSYTSSMMENLLNWAASQMTGFKPIIAPFDVQACVQEVMNPLSDIASKKDIVIINRISEQKACLADVNMTSLVVRNLLHNAIKFTPERGTIVIDVKEDQESLFFTIEDNGQGMDSAQMQIFNESLIDIQTTSTLGTQQEKGTGIGLMLCKSFTQMMNGEIRVQPAAFRGTVFTLRLPRFQNEAEAVISSSKSA